MPLEGKTKVEIEQLLRDYIATVNNPKYKGDMNVINSKFPEFKGMDVQLLQDYIATYNNPDYSGNYEVINEKFPEFFAGVGGTSTQETDPPVKKKGGMVSSSADGSSESQEVSYVSPEEFDKKTLYGESVDNATYVSPEKFDATSRGSAQDDFVRTIDANGGFKSREEVAQDDFVRAVDTDGGFKPREELKFLTGEEADKRLDETLATAEWNQPKEAKEEIKYDPITKEQAAAADVATFPEYSQFEQADVTRLDMPIGEAQAEQVKETIDAIKESQVPTGEESIFILEQERLKSEKEFREREELKRKKEQNLYSNAELEAIKFFKERGRDYEKDKALYDEYNEVRDALIFLEDEKKYQDKDLTPEQRAEFGSAFYYNGVLRTDIVPLKRELNKRRDELASAYLDDEAQQVREDFDQSVMVANKERIDNAVLVNNQAVANINKFNDKSIQKYGVSAEKLNTLKPQTIQEANDINLFIDDYNKAKLESQLAANQYEDASLYLETQFDKDNTLEFVDNFSAIKSQAKEGLSRGNAGDIILQYSMGITPDNEASTKEAAQKIVAALMQKPENKSRVMSRWEKANGFSEGFDVIADDPIEWAVSLAASSMSQMLPYGSKIVAATTATGAGAGAAAAGLAGAGAGAVYGLRAGMATTMFAMEYTNEVMDAISHFGYDISDPDSVAEALQDNKVWARGRERGLKRGIPIAIVDYLTASLAGKVIKVGSVASKAKRIGAMTAERLLVDPLGEASGEAIAQVTVGDELDFKEIVAEAGGGLGNNTSNMAINLARETKSKNRVDLANKFTDINFISKEISSDKQISDWSNNMERLGKINPEVNQRIQKNVGLRRDAKDLQDAAPIERIIYSGKNRAVRARIMTLLAAKEELSSTQNRRSVFGEKIREIDAELASTVETGNLLPQEEQVVLAGQGVLSTTEQASATDVREALPEYRIKKGIRGKMVPVSKEEFLKRIDESSADELQKINATVTNDAEVVGILEEKLKEVKEDAIQEPSTETVDAQEPAEGRPTMGERVPGTGTITEPTEVEADKTEQEVEEKVADIERRREEELNLEKPFKQKNDGSGLVEIKTTVTEEDGIKKTTFKTKTTNRKGESREQADKIYNTIDELFEDLGFEETYEGEEEELRDLATLQKGRIAVKEVREINSVAAAAIVIGGDILDIKLHKRNKDNAKYDAEIAEVKAAQQVEEEVTLEPPFDEDGEMDYEAEEQVRAIAKKRDLGITRDRELASIAKDKEGNIVGGAFAAYDQSTGEYTFDVVVDESVDGKGVGSKLLDDVKDLPFEIEDINPDATIKVHVVNPTMQSMLEKRGFEVVEKVGVDSFIMSPKAEQQVEEEATTEQEVEADEQAVEDFKSTIPDATKSETKTEQQQEEKDDIVETFFESEPSESVSKVSGNLSINRIGEDTQKKSRFRNRVTAVAVKAAKSISKIIPETKIILHESNDEYLKYAKQGEGRAEYNPVQDIIHVNLSSATISTLPHEVFHAVFLNKVKTDERAAKFADTMIQSVRKTLPKNSELAKRIDAFAELYQGDQAQIQNEERVAELIGLLSSKEFGYDTLTKPAKNVVIDFFKRLAKRFNIDLGSDFGDTDASVIDLINTISRKTAVGEEITEQEVSFLESNPYSEGVPVNATENNVSEPRQNKIIYKDVPFVEEITVTSMQEFVEAVEGRLFTVTSDATKVGFDSKGERVDGGFGYTALPENIEGDVGFASLDMATARSTMAKIKNQFKAGEKVGIMIMVQNPSATIGNIYGGKYIGRGLAQIQNADPKAYEDIYKSIEEFVDSNKSVSAVVKKNNSREQLLELLRNPSSYTEAEFANEWIADTSFDARRELLKSMIITSQETRTNKSTPSYKISLKDAGFTMQDFLMEYGDVELLGENNLMEDKGGFLVGGFVMEVPSDIDAESNAVEGRGFTHPQFNGKLPSVGNHVMFDGLYPIQENLVEFAKSESQLIKIKKGETNERVRELAKTKDIFLDKFTNEDSKTYVEPEDRGYTHMKSVAKIIFKKENPDLVEPKTPNLGANTARGMATPIEKRPAKGTKFTPQSRQQRTERLAPNGKQSNLTDVQYDTVRTPAFKKWFGNWESDPENASKVVDENGEPMVTYHGSPSSDIDVFDRQRANEMASGIKEFGTYFATNKKLAESYKQGDGRVYPIFLNIRDMVTFDANGETNIEAWNNLKVKASYKTATNRDAMEFLSPVISKEKGLDGFGVEPVNGIKAENIIDIFIGLGSKQSENYIKAKKDYLGDVYLLFDGQPENAKLADGTNTTFKTESPSIRQQRQLSEESELMTSLNSIVEMGREQGIPDDSLKIILKEKGFKDSDINKALKVDIDLFTAMPKEFGNVEGGVEVGLKLFNETTEKTNKFSTEGPRGGVGTKRTKSFAEIREKAQEILKSNPIYKVQPEQVQLELQVDLDRVLGIKKGPNVSRQIADIRNTLKQRKIGADTITDAQRSLRMFIRKVMPKSKNYSNTALNKLIKAVNNTTPKNFDGQVQVVLNQLEKQRQVLKNEVIDKIIKIARDKSKTARTSANRKRSKGLDAIGQSYFKEAKRVLDLVKNQDFEGLAAMQAEINEELITAALDNIEEGKTLTAKERALIDKQIALDTFADVMTMTLEEVNQLFEEVKTIRAESIARLNNRREARRIAVNNIKEKFNEQISEDFEELYNEEGEQLGKNILRNKREGIYKSFQAKGIWNKVIAFTDEFRENGKFRKSGKYDANGIIKFFRGSLQHLGTTTNILDRGKEGMFTKIFYNQLNDMDEKNLAGVFEQLDVMDSISNSEAGKVWGKWKYTLGTDVLILDGIKESKTGKTYREGLNRDQAMRLYALSLNPVQREKLQKQGFTEEKMKLIEDFIKPEGIGIANQIVDYFSNKYFNEVNNIYVQANDVNLGYVENYFPTRTISAQKKAADMISGDFSKVFTADTSPALQERTDTKGDVEIGMSFTDVVEQHIKDMERYKAYALGVKQMNEVYKSPDIQTLLQETGLFSIFNQNLNYAINPDAGPKTTSGVLSWIQRKFTGFALAFKPIQVLKQATSFVQAYEDYSFVKGKPIPGFDMVMFALDYAKVLSNLPKNIKESKEISATFKNRMKMGMEGDVFGLESGGRTYKKIGSQQGRRGAAVRGFKKAAGIFTVMGDILGVLGYKAVYNRNIANGMSKAEALSAFNNYNATQQTRRSTEKVSLQQDNSFASKYFTMFGSTLFLQMNKTFQSANNIVKNFKPTKGEFGSLKDYRALALNVSVANALFTAAAYSGALLKGDDEDKDRAWQAIKDAALGLNILYQIPLAGTAIEEAVSKARGKRAFTSEGVNPFTSVSRKVQKSYKLLKDDEVIKAVKPIIELSIGAQFDSPIGIYNLIGGSGEDEDFYDALGITPSYRPGYGKRKSKKKSSKSQSKLKKSEVKEFFPDLYKELYEND